MRSAELFLSLFRNVIARRHVKEINRGMRPSRPRRIFTRSEKRGGRALVKHFLIKSKSIARRPDACLRLVVAERAMERREAGTGDARAFWDLHLFFFFFFR